MNEEHHSFDEVASSQDEGRRSTGRGRRRGAPRRHRGPLALLPALLVLLVVAGLGVGGYQGYQWVTSNVSLQGEAADYPGPGTGEVIVEVSEGDTGTDIAGTLVEDGVIKSPGPFISVFSNTPDASSIEPGIYRLQREMNSADALEALMDPANLAAYRVIVPEGRRLSQVWAQLSEETEIPVEDFEAAAEDYTSYGIPENSAGTLEGYLWPGRYDIPEDATAEDVIAMMWAPMEQQLVDREIPESQWHRTLTVASLAEKEVSRAEDYGKVARTIENRLAGVGEAGGTPMKLQFDSTVHYVTGSADSVATTDEERATDDPYNTYVHTGLPPGPIAAPGGPAIEAAAAPPEGDWLYFVTVNTETGETKFAATWSEHEENVAEWQAWEQSKG
ncbi:endolytic transglycosylase MltG [Brachybacterium sp. YJGR34]|uniref:endolytic transglycosylase MltG n=1 Tax=Brachybacterium sp. YJGR34 TaxID=2059911 RepID=UPI000E0A4C29|nr:endolytic transglycosylase MltG [Brachybacterium sp. YJGR34]